MIGIHAILWEAAFWVLALFLLAGAIIGLNRFRAGCNTLDKKRIDNVYTSQFVLILSTLFLAALANLTLRELRFHSELAHLRADAVQQIEIGNRTVTDRKQIVEIVSVLNHAEWYSLRKGDAADHVPFVVKLTSGREYD